MQIAVLGGGNAAYAAAADFARAGHAVRLWRRTESELAPVRSAGLTLAGSGRPQVARLASATTDVGEAVAGAEIVVIAVPATAHEQLGRTLAPHLDDRQIVLLTPGFFGAYVVAREIARVGGRLPFAIAESATAPWIARKTGPGAVAVSARAARLPVGVFPASRTAPAVARLSSVVPGLRPVVDVLDAALANAGPILHPPLALLAAGAGDGVALDHLAATPTARRLAEALDAERVAARAGWGYPAPHYENASYYDEAGGATALAAADGGRPLGLDHRFVTEDVALGLSLLDSAARTATVESPAITGLLLVFGVLTGRRLAAGGRALDHLGLGDLVLREIRGLLAEGWDSPLWTRVIR